MVVDDESSLLLGMCDGCVHHIHLSRFSTRGRLISTVPLQSILPEDLPNMSLLHRLARIFHMAPFCRISAV